MASSKPTGRRRLETLWRPGGLNYRQLAINVIRKAEHDDLLGRASELAFNFLLALFPLLLFLLSVFGLFASRSSQLQNSLLSYFADFLPPTAFQLLKSVTVELAANSTRGKLTFGIVLALWFASGGMSSMISTLNVVYNVREARSWVKVRTLALGLTLAISVLLLSAAFIVLLGDSFVDWMGPKLHISSLMLILWKGLQWAAALAFVIASFSLVYYYGPEVGERRWHWITAGSTFGVLLWLLASGAFRAYLHFFNAYGATYGSLGALMILLVWLYVTGLAFLVGAEVNAEIEHFARRISAEERTASSAAPGKHR